MKHLLAAVIVLFGFEAHAVDWQERSEVGKLFNGAGVIGTFVLYDVAAERFIGHNQTRAETRFVPASTFKIPNTLIGLSTVVVKSVDEVLPYGGHPQPFNAWETDMGLRTAIALS
jgi:beta-lactamase class D